MTAVTADADTPGETTSDRPEAQHVDIRVVSRSTDDLSGFVALCKTIQNLCAEGASRDVIVSIDGDGSADLRFDFGDTDVSDVEGLKGTDDGSPVGPIGIGE